MPVIDSAFNLVFGCRHRRTTFPLTPAKNRDSGFSETPAPRETYVVCLECGKQFIYDWKNMRLGDPVDLSEGSRVAHPEAERVPFRTKSNLRYLLWASALPAAWLIRNAIKSRKQHGASGGSTEEDAQRDNIEGPQTPGPA